MNVVSTVSAIRSLAFIDLEIDPVTRRILAIGSVKNDDSHFSRNSLPELMNYLRGVEFVCGHNIFNHDIRYLEKTFAEYGFRPEIVDTLYLSPLLFPTRPYHRLLKDEKLIAEEQNNPVNDSIKARDLLEDEVEEFRNLDENLKKIFYLLLKDTREFRSFFRFVSYQIAESDTEVLIRETFRNEICKDAGLSKLITDKPIELAYCLSLIHSFVRNKKTHSITPPWVLRTYPDVEQLMIRLRNKRCVKGCNYCNRVLDPHAGLKAYFGFDDFRRYDGEPLQEKAVRAALENRSLLAVFPTGGGKSITFQVPALMSAEHSGALTVVISPLQSLMKDQVDNLEKKGVAEAVTINGLLDPIERAKSFERIEEGTASLLYISPESLRSRSIERLILGRKIARFVIDEAHCFSAWGQDFRVDYLYIGDFIKSIQEKKRLSEPIPVSCFTATAKQSVIEDIRRYFREKLSLELGLFTAKPSRKNLTYKVFEKKDEEEKYQALRSLIEENNCPTIVYVSRTKKTADLAERLNKDGFNARPYHGKLESEIKIENQNAFIEGRVDIMVATSAFGMGVDKSDVGLVVHYEISDSLENYVQEAGRAGRDESLQANCFVLFNEEDLSKHFTLLNQTKLSIKEVQQVWRAIKELTRFRATVSNSALEIARKAGWDDSVVDVETRVTAAVAALEDAGYLRRGQNVPRIFANSILAKTLQEAAQRIDASGKFDENQKTQAIRILRSLFSSKSKRAAAGDDTAESRIDYISDRLGIEKRDVINIIHLLREEKILADFQDLSAFVKRSGNDSRSQAIVKMYYEIEKFLLEEFDESEKEFFIKELNEKAEEKIKDVTPNRIKTVLNFLSVINWIDRKNSPFSKNHFSVVCRRPVAELKEALQKRVNLANFITEELHRKSRQSGNTTSEEVLVEFSVHELKDAYERHNGMFQEKVTIGDVQDALFYLSRIEAVKIEGGFLVLYNRLTIERTELNPKKQYTKDDYQKLQQFYDSRVQQIHIVGEYAKKMIDDYQAALRFVEDYFQLNYYAFLEKYFRGSRQTEIKRAITPEKFRSLFGALSPAQLRIINDKDAKQIVVAAGPGSGKTRVLVHKLASLLLMEDVKHEQLLMLTFSRAAATEFKERLVKLIGTAAHFVEIKTFHSYCFDLLGRIGSLEKSNDILKTTTARIRANEVEASRITKTVLVIDEAQDMNEDEFDLVRALMEQNEEMRVIAVGDDDQNVYEFRGSSSQYLKELITKEESAMHELVENYRSKRNLVAFSNQFVNRISNRLKHTPIVSRHNDNGKIKIVRYWSSNLVVPVVEDIVSAPLSGTTCVLTKTNKAAMQIAGLLLKKGLPAKLIQENKGFNLGDLQEVRHFMNRLSLNENVFVIDEEIWEKAKRETWQEFRGTRNVEVFVNIIRKFEAANSGRKYKSDLEVFIKESNLEDFFGNDSEVIQVSTIHKAKGREFDNVFLLLKDFDAGTDAAKRQLYVAMTRTKSNLYIHVNSGFLDDLEAENLERVENRTVYDPSHEMVRPLFHEDVWLSYFLSKQREISQLKSGDDLVVRGGECFDRNGRSVLRFSKKCLREIDEIRAMHYEVTRARVNFIVYWKGKDEDREILIILPELYFEKKS